MKQLIIFLLVCMSWHAALAGDHRALVRVTAQCKGDAIILTCDRLVDVLILGLSQNPELRFEGPQNAVSESDIIVEASFETHQATTFANALIRYKGVTIQSGTESGPPSALLGIIQRLSGEINSRIRIIEEVAVKNIAVAFEISAKETDKLTRKMASNQSLELPSSRQVKFSLAPQKDFTRYDVEQLAAKKEYDAVLSVSIVRDPQSKLNVKLLSKLYKKGENHVLELPEQKFESSKIYLNSYINELSHYLTDTTGNWNSRSLDSLSSLVRKREYRVERGEVAFGKNSLTWAGCLALTELQEETSSAKASFLLAKIRYGQNRWEECSFFLNECRPGELEALEYNSLKGLTNFKLGLYKQAELYLRNVYERAPTTTYSSEDIAWYLGRTYLELDSATEAVKILTYYHSKKETSLSGYWLGKAYIANKEVKKGIRTLEKLSASEYKDVNQLLGTAHFFLGESYFSKSDYSLAYEEYLKSWRYTAYEGALTKMVFCLNGTNQWVRADSLIEIHGEKNPVLYKKQGEELRDGYEISLKTDKDKVLIKESTKFLLKYEKRLPGDASVLWLIGNNYTNMNEYKDAVIYLEKSFALDTTIIDHRLDLAEANMFVTNPARVRELASLWQINYWNEKGLIRNRALLLFLRYTANIMLGMKEPQTESELKRELKSKNTIYNWNLGPFYKWLNASKFKSNTSLQKMAKELEDKIRKSST